MDNSAGSLKLGTWVSEQTTVSDSDTVSGSATSSEESLPNMEGLQADDCTGMQDQPDTLIVMPPSEISVPLPGFLREFDFHRILSVRSRPDEFQEALRMCRVRGAPGLPAPAWIKCVDGADVASCVTEITLTPPCFNPFKSETEEREVAGPPMSVGSVGHPISCSGEGCKFLHKKQGCRDGTACSRCHFCVWRRSTERMSYRRKRATKLAAENIFPEMQKTLDALVCNE